MGLSKDNSSILEKAYNANTGGFDVNIQDQTTAPVIIKMSIEKTRTTIATPNVIDTNTIVVNDATGIAEGDRMGLFDDIDNRLYTGGIVAVNGNTLTLDTPLNAVYPAGSDVIITNINMNVDGSVNRKIFKLRTGSLGIPFVVDITRMIVSMATSDEGNFTEFGDIVDGLTNGIVFRRTDGIIQNIFNAKTNKDLATLAYDFEFIPAKAPADAGLKMRLTFSGQEKMGVALRVSPDEDLEMIIQDDLTSLIRFEVMLQGHVVED